MRDKHYQQKNYHRLLYSGLLGYLFRWQHKVLSPEVYKKCEKVLEIGPSFEPHIKYTKLNYKKYYCLEINDGISRKEYYNKKFPNIIYNTYDGKKLNFKNNFFDRIIISQTLEHILNFEIFLNEMMRVLKYGCVISIASPCDNGFLWRFGRFLFKKTYNKFKKINSLEYDYLVAKEHVNTIFQILAILRKKFTIVKEVYLPFKIKIIDLNLIHICHIMKKK
jgi:SAM-dependent methyltransferase